MPDTQVSPGGLIEVMGASKTYRTVSRKEVFALEPTRLTIAPGEFVAVVAARSSSRAGGWRAPTRRSASSSSARCCCPGDASWTT
jgi:hypothetical protein